MAAESPFTPTGATVTLSPTSSSNGAAVSGLPSGANSGVLRVVNAGPNVAFFRWSNASATAVTTDMPILPGAVEVFSVGNCTHVAAICATGSATVYVTPGNGQ